jgi:RNA polymerase sigma-70 factor, ECF subfamily
VVRRQGACSRVLGAAVGCLAIGGWTASSRMGSPVAVAAYLHALPFGVAVLDVRRNGIAGITVFVDPALVERFTLLCRWT